MISLKNTSRYDILKNQFYIDIIDNSSREQIEESLYRIFLFVYNHTKITHIDFINEKILLEYIQFHRSTQFQEVSFTGAIKDIKNFLYFLKTIKKQKYIPKVDLSLSNYGFWNNLVPEEKRNNKQVKPVIVE